MIVVCDQCGAKFKLTVKKQTAKPISFKCGKCAAMIQIAPEQIAVGSNVPAPADKPPAGTVSVSCSKCGGTFVKPGAEKTTVCYQCRIDSLVSKVREKYGVAGAEPPPPEPAETEPRYTVRTADGLVLGPIKIRTVSVLAREKRIKGVEEVSKDSGPYRPLMSYPELAEMFPELKDIMDTTGLEDKVDEAFMAAFKEDEETPGPETTAPEPQVMETPSPKAGPAEEEIQEAMSEQQAEDVPEAEPLSERQAEEVPFAEPAPETETEEVPAAEAVSEPQAEDVPETEPAPEPVVEEVPAAEAVSEPQAEDVPEAEPAPEPQVEDVPEAEAAPEPLVEEASSASDDVAPGPEEDDGLDDAVIDWSAGEVGESSDSDQGPMEEDLGLDSADATPAPEEYLEEDEAEGPAVEGPVAGPGEGLSPGPAEADSGVVDSGVAGAEFEVGEEWSEDLEDDEIIEGLEPIEEPPPDTRYRIRYPDGLILGPVKLETIRELYDSGNLTGQEEVQRGDEDWAMFADLPELAVLSSPPGGADEDDIIELTETLEEIN